MDLFESGNGAPSLIEIGYKTLWSWHMYSIDEINRGYARPNSFGRLKLELCRVTDSGFSDLTDVYWGGCPEVTFWHILTHFCEICVS